jgi:ketosteroid isomerase-like protein
MNTITAKKVRSPAESRNLELVEAAFANWKNGTGSVFDLLAPQAQWTIVGHSAISAVYRSKEEFMATAIAPLDARLSSPLVPSMRGLYADDDVIIAHFDAAATARDGRPYRNTYSWYLRLRHDRIVEATAFFDSVALNDLFERVPPRA